jgi:hypothetical protein
VSHSRHAPPSRVLCRSLAATLLLASCAPLPEMAPARATSQSSVPVATASPVLTPTGASQPTSTREPTPTAVPIALDALEVITRANVEQLQRVGRLGVRPPIVRSDGPPVLAQPASDLMVIASSGGFVALDLHPLRERYSVSTLVAGIYALDISSDAKHIATGHGDGSIFVWDAGTGREEYMFEPFGTVDYKWIDSLDFSSDGTLLVVGGGAGTALWSMAGKEVVRTLTSWNTLGVAFSPDSRQVATLNYSGSVDLWDVASGAKSGTLAPGRTTPRPRSDSLQSGRRFWRRRWVAIRVLWSLSWRLAR